MNKSKEELLCQECDRKYPVWYTENEPWNMLVYALEAEIGIPVNYLCPTCFTMLYEKRIKKPHAWKLLIPTRENRGV